MRFNNIVVSSIALLLAPIVSWAACTGSSPTWTSTADYASVNSCVGSATAGDTINVQAGTETWASVLTINNKGIKLIGAGIGSTVITRGGTRIIAISDPANTNLLRVSGFTFKTTGSTEGTDGDNWTLIGTVSDGSVSQPWNRIALGNFGSISRANYFKNIRMNNVDITNY